MRLDTNKCYVMLERDRGDKLILLKQIEFVRTYSGQNRLLLTYSEVWDYFETRIDFEDVEYIYAVDIDDKIKKRLIEKYGEDFVNKYVLEV